VTVMKGFTRVFLKGDIEEIRDVFVVVVHNIFHQIVPIKITFRVNSGTERLELNIFILFTMQIMKAHLSRAKLAQGVIRVLINECRGLELTSACSKMQEMQ